MLEWLTVSHIGELADALGVRPAVLVDALDRPAHEFGRGDAK